MKQKTLNEIRKLWLDYFESKEHYKLEPKSLVPIADNSLLFINSGVATVKDYLSGAQIPPSKRLTNIQRALRTNDIENVGITSRHHTLFEMLGNFSIGDYFKQEAIEFAWEFLTDSNWIGLPKEKLYVTIHPDDEETYQKWLEVGMPENKIIKTEENFWEIGQGPGGPNTEIFYDRGEKYDSRDPYELIEKDLETDRVIELWNVVFSQYFCDPENLERNQYETLPQKNIDTGLGIERLACILQDVETNFEIREFQVIIDKLIEIISKKNPNNILKYEDHKMVFRVIADHMRAVVFAIADGVLPANDGRGYVIRRLIRRALKYGIIELMQEETKKDKRPPEPVLHSLVGTVIASFVDFYPYLEQKQDYIEQVILEEEKRFLKTIMSGMKIINQYAQDDYISGEEAFKLYDTYGFPIELVQEVARNRDLEVDIEGYHKKFEEARELARKAQKKHDSFELEFSDFRNYHEKSCFIGYNVYETNSKVIYSESHNQEIQKVILDKTPFYATSGGQKHDVGKIDESIVLAVHKLPNGQHIHFIHTESSFEVGQEVFAQVDMNIRKQISQNHTVTHLLHLALHEIVGENALQAGSSQDEIKTRFDYSSLSPLTTEKQYQIEDYVNQLIKQKQDVKIETMKLDEAKELGAMALFGEKYAQDVRVVQIGKSIELCGGTHVANSQEVEKFHIISETGIGSGIRRIEALTSNRVDEYTQKIIQDFHVEVDKLQNKQKNGQEIKVKNLSVIVHKLEQLAKIVTIDADKYQQILNQLEEKNNQVHKDNLQKNSSDINELVTQLTDKIEKKDGISWLEANLENKSMKELRPLSDQLIQNLETGVLVLSGQIGDKIAMIVKCTKDVTDKYKAKEILNERLKAFNGSGGGNEVSAQGGATIS